MAFNWISGAVGGMTLKGIIGAVDEIGIWTVDGVIGSNQHYVS